MRRTSISMTFGFIIVLLVFSAVVSFFPSLNKYALYGALPLAFVLSFTEVTENNLRNVLHNTYIVWFIVLYIWYIFQSYLKIIPSLILIFQLLICIFLFLKSLFLKG